MDFGLTLSKLLEIPLSQEVAERYRKSFPQNKLTAEVAFRELLKYLWICDKLKKDKIAQPQNPEFNFNIYIQDEMQEIDDLWHTYLLFTRQYQKLCLNAFGRFIHHEPVTHEENKMKDKEEFLFETQKALEYVYEHLGEDTLKIWYKEYFPD